MIPELTADELMTKGVGITGDGGVGVVGEIGAAATIKLSVDVAD